MPDPIIEVERLERDFGDVKAVKDVTFTIERGTVAGFIGANGAGKTTTMRMMVTLETPTAGTIRIGGDDVTVYEYLDFFGRAFGYPRAERLRRLEEVMDFTDLTPLADRAMNSLSKGMNQRLCLGRTLIHDPEVLVLDEPAAGLDPKARIEFKNLIRLLAGKGKTIFISSHILSELGEMCDQLVFIDNGRIVHHGSTESLTRQTGSETLIEVRIAGDPEPLYQWIATATEITLADRHKDGARIRTTELSDEAAAALLRRMVLDGVAVKGFTRLERRLEDAFVDMLRMTPPPLP